MIRKSFLEDKPIDIEVDIKRHLYTAGNLKVKSNQKCSCRTLRDAFDAMEKLVSNKKINLDKKLHIFVFRNIKNRLISGYIDIYAYKRDEYNSYLINRIKNKSIINNFNNFVKEIYKNSTDNIDDNHFCLQTSHWMYLENTLDFKLDFIFNSEEIYELFDFIFKYYDIEEKYQELIYKNIKHIKDVDNKNKNFIIRHQNINNDYKINEKLYKLSPSRITKLYNNNIFLPYKDYYNKELHLLTEEIYKQDIKFIEYHMHKIKSEKLKNSYK